MWPPLIWFHPSYLSFNIMALISPFLCSLIYSEIKEVKRKKARAKELEGIDVSNIVSSSRRRSTSSFAAPPPPPPKPKPKPKVPVETSGNDAEGSDNGNDDEDNDNEEEGEEDEEEDSSDDNGSQSEEFNDGKSILNMLRLCFVFILLVYISNIIDSGIICSLQWLSSYQIINCFDRIEALLIVVIK